jgi:hypothetical protein
LTDRKVRFGFGAPWVVVGAVLAYRLLLLVEALVAGAHLLAVSRAPRLVHTRATWEAT